MTNIFFIRILICKKYFFRRYYSQFYAIPEMESERKVSVFFGLHLLLDLINLLNKIYLIIFLIIPYIFSSIYRVIQSLRSRKMTKIWTPSPLVRLWYPRPLSCEHSKLYITTPPPPFHHRHYPIARSCYFIDS